MVKFVEHFYSGEGSYAVVVAKFMQMVWWCVFVTNPASWCCTFSILNIIFTTLLSLLAATRQWINVLVITRISI